MDTQPKIQKSSMEQFGDQMSAQYGFAFADYGDLYRWSIKNPETFWSEVIKFFPVIYNGELSPALKQKSFLPYPWFPRVKINFAENLLQSRDENQVAIVDVHESGRRREISYGQLKREVARMAAYLKDFVGEGEVVAAYMPNCYETVVIMLATTSLGGVFTSTSSDFGVTGVVDRFGQARPKVMFYVPGYEYGGKTFDLREKISEIKKELAEIKKFVQVNFLNKSPDFLTADNEFHQIIKKNPTTTLSFKKMNFSDPLYIMYSSGTTGKPKCIIHSIGGTLLQHVKEIGLHADFNQHKTIFFFTTCGWMMWNWLVSSLFFKGKIVLYEGSPAYPSLSEYIKIIEREKINIFGTSPKFLSSLQQENLAPFKFKNLATILSTGSPLLPEQYDFVEKQFSPEVHLASISGGTDIIGCFMLGHPLAKTKRGKIQAPGLGMEIDCFDNEGKSIKNAEGELVCKSPFISQPLGFLNDKNNEAIKKAYFEAIPGVWHHGDFIMLEDDLSVTVLGRSDATLNPGGVRIGTAEIYRQTEKLEFIEDSLCVGKEVQGDVEVWLFVKMRGKKVLSEENKNEIKKIIKMNTTPRHVPKQIVAVDGIPYTRSGKKMELAVNRILSGRPLTNLEAVMNPECLKEYQLYESKKNA
jgi:acetoacetyl-CoA synthetase